MQNAAVAADFLTCRILTVSCCLRAVGPAWLASGSRTSFQRVRGSRVGANWDCSWALGWQRSLARSWKGGRQGLPQSLPLIAIVAIIAVIIDAAITIAITLLVHPQHILSVAWAWISAPSSNSCRQSSLVPHRCLAGSNPLELGSFGVSHWILLPFDMSVEDSCFGKKIVLAYHFNVVDFAFF